MQTGERNHFIAITMPDTFFVISEVKSCLLTTANSLFS